MITWVMVGLLLAAETCGRNVLSGNGNGNGKEETKQRESLKGVNTDEEDIYRGYRHLTVEEKLTETFGREYNMYA